MTSAESYLNLINSKCLGCLTTPQMILSVFSLSMHRSGGMCLLLKIHLLVFLTITQVQKCIMSTYSQHSAIFVVLGDVDLM